jgi:hypothetical protein
VHLRQGLAHVDWCSRLKAQGSGLKAQGSGLRAQGSRLKAQCSGLKAQGSLRTSSAALEVVLAIGDVDRRGSAEDVDFSPIANE